jgi:hypothetical protein
VIGALKSVGAARTVKSGGTYVEQRVGNLDNLLYALEVGEIQLQESPSPSPDSPAER